MAFDFPAAPTLGEEYISGTSAYTFDGEVWRKVEVESQRWVAKGGDLMTGELGLPVITPLAPETATNKKYVDEAIAATALYQGVWQVAANTPDLTPGVVAAQHSYSWIAVTADPAVPEVVPPGITGIEGTSLTEGDTVLWNGLLGTYEVIHAVALSGNFVSKTGDVMTGALHIQNAPGAGMMSLLTGDTTNNARIDWINPDGTRKAYIGYRGPTDLEINLDSADRLLVNGQTVQLTGGIAGTGYFIGDIYHGMCFNGSNTTQFHEYHGNFEFKHKTSAIDTVLCKITVNGVECPFGMSFGSAAQASATDLSRHIALYGTTFGFSITSGTLNYVVPASNFHKFYIGGVSTFEISNGNTHARGILQCRNVCGNIWNTKSLLVTHGNPDGSQAATPGEAGIAFYNHNGSDGGIRKHVFTLEKVADRFVARNGDDAAGGCIKFVAAGFDTVSDLSLKHDVRPMEMDEAAIAFAALNPIRYRWNVGEDQRLHWGLSANDLEAGAPDAVTTGSFGEKSYGIEQVLSICVAKIQALEAEIAELRAGGYRGV
jgi:Chaperone of endosialidase